MHPYSSLPERAFWRTAVAARSLFEIDDLWVPKFRILPTDRVATFGSCFAQHIGQALRGRGFCWYVPEQPPKGLSETNGRKYGYNVFSSRTGNIYTTSLLKQWTSWAIGDSVPPDEVWVSEGAYFDPFRPQVEPGGFANKAELLRSRETTIDAFRDCIMSSKYFVFTLGLTESWHNAHSKFEYPLCPGTVCGEYEAGIHKFTNQEFLGVSQNLADSIRMMRALNPDLNFILTVSPVPLTATQTKNHVLVATTYSKSVLRAVAGQLANNNHYIDYFPSYEIINSPVFRGVFSEPNQRNATKHGVDFVMNHFFSGLTKKFGRYYPSSPQRQSPATHDAVCEEELLDAFAKP